MQLAYLSLTQRASLRIMTVVAAMAMAFAMFLIAGCANGARATGQNSSKYAYWSGRISLQVASEQPQAFFASFELKGSAERGELTLSSPLGSILGVLKWSPGEAVLQSGTEVKRSESVDRLLESTTGAAVPVEALFDWLDGQSNNQAGWSADLTQYAQGKIEAVRTEPAPLTRLRVVLDQ